MSSGEARPHLDHSETSRGRGGDGRGVRTDYAQAGGESETCIGRGRISAKVRRLWLGCAVARTSGGCRDPFGGNSSDAVGRGLSERQWRPKGSLAAEACEAFRRRRRWLAALRMAVIIALCRAGWRELSCGRPDSRP